jgi:NitT/TauT family transport system permease protein
MLNAFRPNRSLSRKAWALILAAQAALLLACWSLGDALLIPGPLDTLGALARLIREEGLLYELTVSLKTNVQAIGLSATLSIGLAYLTVLPVMRPFVEFCSKARFFGLTGFMVVFTMAFGGGHALKVSLLTFGMSVFFVTSMSSVVASIPKDEWDQARSLRMSDWRMVWEIVVLGKADEAFEVLRQNAAIGWMMLTMVEGMVRSEGGIGALMLNQNKHFRLDAVFAIQLTVLLVGILQDRAIAYLKNVFCPYANLTLERQ